MSSRLADTVCNQARARFVNKAKLPSVFRNDSVTFRKKTLGPLLQALQQNLLCRLDPMHATSEQS
jgi:hypothetical protein